jgi:SAM-dependent methyltransferase
MRERRIVRDGYDRAADAYRAWAAGIVDDPRDRFLARFAAAVPKGGEVLDLGCGAGLPSTATLARDFHVTAVDISTEQIDRARVNVPEARFVVADVMDVPFERGSFDGVTAFYAVSHVPRSEHAELFRRIASWLRPGGLFLASLGAQDSPDWIGEWLGVPMFFSSFDAETNARLLQEAGFEILENELVTMREPEGDAAFQWVVAKATRRSSSES